MAARVFALSENLYYNDYVFDEQKGRMTDMKKAIIVLLTAAVAAGITLTAAGLPASKAYADVATPGNLVTEESDTGGEEAPAGGGAEEAPAQDGGVAQASGGEGGEAQ